jgi:serine O-acetyltransferase
MTNLKKRIEQFYELTMDIMFPIRNSIQHVTEIDVNIVYPELLSILNHSIVKCEDNCDVVAKAFISYLPKLKEVLAKDVEAIYEGDPAANSHEEIILAYPGFTAVSAYRIAHFLIKHSVRLVPRMITEYAHSMTGVDIHPSAQIGEYLCIDHGTGVVIGETTVIGDHVKIYQGVTLGALSIPRRDCQGQRHPTIEDHVVIYAQAIILGGDTTIGAHSVIGGNVWITESIAPYSKVYYEKQQRKIDIK